MYRKVLVPVLLFLSLMSIVYAIYRSTDQQVTISGIGRQVISGEPQHGLILGLCFFAGICVLGAVLLLLNWNRTVEEIREEKPASMARKTATNYPQ